MKKIAIVCVVLTAGMLASCERYKYQIEMAVQGDLLLRKLSVSATMTDNEGTRPQALSDDMIARLAKLYPTHRIEEDQLTHTFRGQFKDRTPDDVGGAGFVVNLQTPMGSAVGYIERFRGDDDLLDQVNRRTQAVDRVMDLLVGWLARELGQQEGFARLRAFLDKDLRNDLKNLSLYAWVANSDASRDADPNGRQGAPQEIAARAIQCLLERGYLKPADSPLVYRAIRTEGKDQVRAVLALIGRVLAARQVPADEALMGAIGKLFADPKAASESLEAYLTESAEYRRRLAQWEQDPNRKGDQDKPEPTSVLTDALGQAVGIELFAVTDELELKLACPSTPLATNGRYDELAKVLSWSRELQQTTSTVPRMPVICYAVWARPDEKFQREHFGRVVLQDRALLEYCLWHKSLDANEAKRWEAFVLSLRPGADLAERLAAFQVNPPPEVPGRLENLEEPPPDYAQRILGLILNGLTAAASGPASAPAER